MKKIFISTLFLLSVPAFLTGQTPDIKSDVKITEVTVYTSGARIFGEKKLEVPAGNSAVRFTGIPSDLETGTIQVSASGEVTILSVNHELDYLTEKEQSPAVKNLIRQRDALEKNTGKEKMQLEILADEMLFMQANMKVTGTNTTTKVTDLAPVYDYFVSKITEINRERKWRNDSLNSWSEQISRINKQIGDLISQEKKPAGVIVVNLDAPARTNVLFRLNYLVPGAGWYPTYDLRVKNIESPVQVTYKANLFQNSGNDWKDVILRFSSANPSQTGILPELEPWFLDIQVPQRIVVTGYGVRQNQVMMKKADVMEEKEEADAAIPIPMTRQEAGTVVEFLMGKPFSVPSSGKNFQVDISEVSLPAEYSYLTVPKIDPAAHLKARLTGWEQLNLMPGEANVYFEGSFTGKTYLNAGDFSDTLEISLGIDRNISVQRTLEKELSTTRFLASKTEASKSWKIAIRNNKAEKIKVKILDQIPISANSDIEVTETKITGGRLNPETGEVTWETEIKPSEKAEKKISYTVRYPKGKKINLE